MGAECSHEYSQGRRFLFWTFNLRIYNGGPRANAADLQLMNNENFVYDGVEGNFSSGHPAPSNTGIIHRQSFAALPSTTNNRLDHLPH
jgi:hypothetical protein